MRLPANEIHICSWEKRGEPDARLKPPTVDTARGAIDPGDNCWYLRALYVLPGFAMALATAIADAVIVTVGIPRAHDAVDQR